jgi:serine/threonine-protein kinase
MTTGSFGAAHLTGLSTALASRYRLEREIGAGGMATVWLAEDVRHGRRVAIKVLHPELSAVLGPERFLAEIRTTANLQHPHILPLFDSGSAGGLLYYVMPYVEGETLRARLERERQLPIADGLRLATEIADALHHAHARGVVHRDVKPENILLQGGHALVADFGIALAVQQAGGQRMTQTGLSLGTPQYMAPEQAMGERGVDARADVYALGAVTYEMLAGEPPFTGPNAQAIVARVLTERPRPLRAARDTVPPAVEHAVLRALEKLPADRFASAREFTSALDGTGGAAAAQHRTAGIAAAPPFHGWPRVLGVAGWGTAAVLGAGLAAVLLRRPAPPDAPVIRTHLETGQAETALTGPSQIRVSPQGDRVAYVVSGPAGVRTFVRRANELAGRDIGGVMENLTFSPDGRWLAFAQGGVIQKIRADGGQGAVTVGASPRGGVIGLSWTPRGDLLVIGSPSGLWTIPAGGGAVRRVPGVDTTTAAAVPLVLADGNTVLYAAGSGGPFFLELTAATLSGDGATPLGLRGARAVGVVDGWLVVLSRSGPLSAVPFDPRRRRLTGEPVQLEADVATAALSATGTLAYVPGQSVSRLVLVSGAQATPVLPEPRRYVAPRFSPDGRRIAVAVAGPAWSSTGPGTQSDIWVYDVVARTFTRLTTQGDNSMPEWTPDGSRIVYRVTGSPRRTIWWRPADGSAEAQQLLDVPESVNEAVVSPDARWLVYRTPPGGVHSRDIFALPFAGRPLTGAQVPIPLVTGPAAEQMPRLSPDGRWLAYQSDESSQLEVYVRPFPGPGARVQVSDAGGIEPLWARSGRALLYRTPRGIVSVDVATSPTFAVGVRRTVLTGDYLTESTHPAWDVSPDGRAFLMLEPAERRTQPVVVHHWARELRERLARVPE